MSRKSGRSRGRHSRSRSEITKSVTALQLPGNRGVPAGGIPLGDAVNALTLRSQQGGFWPMASLPRDPRDTVAFGPLHPLAPAPLDPPRPDTGRPEPRTWEYEVGWNIPGNDQKEIPWSVLRMASVGVDIIRRCIEIRKKHVRALKWSWGLGEEAISEALRSDPGRGRDDVEFELREKFLPEIRRLNESWKRPWPSQRLSFGQWVNGVVEDHLVLDANAIYPRLTYGGEVTAFELIDGATIKPLLNNRGALPAPPHPAYQQALYGFPRGEWTADVDVDDQGNQVIRNGYASDRLFYHRENYRTNSPYGLSAVEQALLASRLYLRRQGWMLAEYDDGSTPLTWLVPQADKLVMDQLSPAQRRAYEQAINDDMAGDTARRHRIKMAYPGYEPIQMPSVDERYKPDYDLHLIKMVASFFGVTIAELGFTEAKGLGNSGFHEGQEAVEDRVGLGPDVRMLSDIVDDLGHSYQRAPQELSFQFIDPTTENETEADAVADARLKRMSITINDDRKRIGKAPLDIPEADTPFVVGTTGLIFLEGALERAQQAQVNADAMVQAKVNPQPVDEPGDDEELVDDEDKGGYVSKAIMGEIVAYRRWLRKNADRTPPRPFRFEHAEPTDLEDRPDLDLSPERVEFAEWTWIAEDIVKSLGADIVKAYEAWWPRDARGRWIKRGHLSSIEIEARLPEGGREALRQIREMERVKKPRAPKTPSVSTRRIPDSSGTIGSMNSMSPAAQEALYNIGTLRQGARVSDVNLQAVQELVNLGYLGPGRGLTRRGTVARQRLVDARLERMMGDQPSINPPPSSIANAPDAADSKPLADQRAAAAKGMGITHPQIAADVRDIVARLGPKGYDGWVSLADLRDEMGEKHNRHEVDLTLREMARQPDVRLIPAQNLKSLKQRDRDSSLTMGGEQQNAIRITAPTPERTESEAADSKLLADQRAAAAKPRKAKETPEERLARRRAENEADRLAYEAAQADKPSLEQIEAMAKSNGLKAVVLRRDPLVVSLHAIEPSRDGKGRVSMEMGRRVMSYHADSGWRTPEGYEIKNEDVEKTAARFGALADQRATAAKSKLRTTSARTEPGGDLASSVASGVASERILSGGESADVQLVTFNDGTQAVRKKIKEDMGGWSPKDQADSEELAGYVAEALDVRAPKVERVSKDTMYQDYIPGKTARELYGKVVPDDILSSDQGIRMGLLDHITNNTDRHAGNWIVSGGDIAAIDNGMMFNYSTTIGHNPFGKAHFDEDTPNALTPEDVAVIRSRLQALEPKFRDMRRLGWYRKMMSQLNEVGRNASGERGLYVSGIAKAAGADGPKAEATPDERWPAWLIDTLMATTAAEEVVSALEAAVVPVELAAEFVEWAAAGAAAGLALDVLGWLRQRGLPEQVATALAQPLEGAWAEGWLAGGESARAAVAYVREHGSLDGATRETLDVEWDWPPGHPEAARRILSEDGRIVGLRQLLNANNVRIRGITDTQLDDIASILADGIEAGKSPKQIATALQGVISDRKRAMRIAVTEVNRAVSAATLDAYRRDDIPAKGWMTARDQRVCPICKNNEDAGAALLDELFPSGDSHPPAHPWCRCALIPEWPEDKIMDENKAVDGDDEALKRY